jgi:antitoxin YxxD
MKKKYEYIKQFKYNFFERPKTHNYFYPVTEKEICNAEKKMGFPLPSELREFYLEIGSGKLPISINEKDENSGLENRILPPEHLEDIMTGTSINEETGLYFSRDNYEDMQPGDLPFFEIFDSSKFLFMKINSDNPNAVWTISSIKIEDSFERFIWRLYHEKSDFYDDVILNYYKSIGYIKDK